MGVGGRLLWGTSFVVGLLAVAGCTTTADEAIALCQQACDLRSSNGCSKGSDCYTECDDRVDGVPTECTDEVKVFYECEVGAGAAICEPSLNCITQAADVDKCELDNLLAPFN